MPLSQSDTGKTGQNKQLAFGLSRHVQSQIKKLAISHNLKTSDEMRRIIGLDFTKIKKNPRLTLVVSEEDRINIGELYNIDPENEEAVREVIKLKLTQEANSAD
jgi:hypothetical protein